MHCLTWERFLYVLAEVIDHESCLAFMDAGHESVINPQGALLHNDGRRDLATLLANI